MEAVGRGFSQIKGGGHFEGIFLVFSWEILVISGIITPSDHKRAANRDSREAFKC
jgi:hypothetical protein